MVGLDDSAVSAHLPSGCILSNTEERDFIAHLLFIFYRDLVAIFSSLSSIGIFLDLWLLLFTKERT